jgi:hypothetical protein
MMILYCLSIMFAQHDRFADMHEFVRQPFTFASSGSGSMLPDEGGGVR